MKILWTLVTVAWLSASLWAEEPLTRIAFGSCYKPQKETKIWAQVEKFKPQLWIWLGDNFYNDWAEGKYMKSNDDPEAFQKGYALLRQSEAMKSLQRIDPKIMATWDDHDYGQNDAGKDYPRKEESRNAFVKFFGGPDRPDGVYSSKDFGPAGQCVRVILLDTRYNRDPLPRKGMVSPDGDMLGEVQWQWLEGELSKPGANLVVVGSSVQLVSDLHPYEKWANFPKARARFLNLLAQTKAKGVVIISGDRHWAEISRLSDNPAGYPLYDITSSGLTEKASLMKEKNPARVGSVFIGYNFGGIRIDWSKPDPEVDLEIYNEAGEVPVQTIFSLSQLAPRGL
ncbi:MAG: alkaline phosphatase D family protein [Verrucomicrobia bacterium]|nr:alkaline phosphatase D family protein [Verrucomicrobiota bacterium]